MSTRHLGWAHTCDRCGQQVTTSSDDRPEGWLTLATINVPVEKIRDGRDVSMLKTICHACSRDFDLWCRP